MKLAWATDVHFDHLDEEDVLEFCRRVAESSADALLLGGDISNAKDLADHLATLGEHVPMPVYFVLGNHDYYGGSVAAVQDQVGDFDEAPVLTDYIAIAELVKTAGRRNVLTGMKNRTRLRRRLHELGNDAAESLRPALLEAAALGGHVIVLTHVPPFPEAAWHEGEPSTIRWQRGFTCKAVGDLLREAASDHPSCRFTVLCGHTHGSGRAAILPNLDAVTAGADYGNFLVNAVNWNREELTVRLT